MSNLIKRARILRRIIENMAKSLTDEEALESVELVQAWDPDGFSYSVGDRVRYDGVLYKVIQTHTSQDDWTPDNAPSLFAKILPGQDGTDIGEWVQPDSTNPYMKGDRVTYNGKTYESTVDNNVWAPDVYGWIEVSD